MDDSQAEPCRKGEWEKRFRSAPLPAITKAVGFIVATYADGDGTSARPGNALLVDDLGLSRRAISSHLTTLRESGWLLLVRNGSNLGRQAKVSEYRLSRPIAGADPQVGSGAPPCT